MLPIPRQRQAPPGGPGPRQDYLDAFDEDDVFAARPSGGPQRPDTAETAVASAVPPARNGADGTADDTEPDGEPPVRGKAVVPKGRTFTGIAAAAVTTVLAVVVAGQVADGHSGARTQAAPGGAGDV
ncbi:hypothetical protein GTW59_39855, partial [Streptomyces sp. SID89]|nr:hypothetical protein [Streptomyces sp. SID89]